MYLISISIATLSIVVYHLAMKKLPEGSNPAGVLALIYFFAFLLSCLLMFVWKSPETLNPLQIVKSDPKLLIFCVVLGVAVVGIEGGFLLAYRAGWSPVWAPLVANAFGSAVMIPISMYFLREGISAAKVIGAIFCFVGVYLVTAKS
jgi:drug/metabolite transporter (DMT)-like permease